MQIHETGFSSLLYRTYCKSAMELNLLSAQCREDRTKKENKIIKLALRLIGGN